MKSFMVFHSSENSKQTRTEQKERDDVILLPLPRQNALYVLTTASVL